MHKYKVLVPTGYYWYDTIIIKTLVDFNSDSDQALALVAVECLQLNKGRIINVESLAIDEFNSYNYDDSYYYVDLSNFGLGCYFLLVYGINWRRFMNKSDLNVMFSNNSDHWATPKALIDFIDFDLDICPLHFDGDNLVIEWPDDTVIYCNPPYSEATRWIDKIIEQCSREDGPKVKLLIPARTDTKYFHKLYDSGLIKKIVLFKGRLHFNEASSAPFPSILIYVGWLDTHMDRLDTYDTKEDIARGRRL